MTGSRRWALLGLVIVVAVGGFLIARSGGNDNTTTTSGSLHIVVKGGKPVGGVQKLVVKKGGQVRFSVTSDVADEVHVHGYDFHKDVVKGGTVSFAFPARIDGKFEAELEARKEQILDLVVEP